MFKTPLKRGRILAMSLVPVLVLTACTSENPKRTRVSADRIVGDWTGSSGERLSFSADRAFTSSGLDSKNLADERCPGEKATGSWAFFADQGDGLYGTSEKAGSGDEIGLAFGKESQEDCTINLSVVDDGKTLCASNDPDLSCGLDVRFTRKK
ncbi:hypothetical protein AB0D74_20690 [Streptomyces sp. NPDC048278]|uniref:hypothetical protein n=1 Tax=Streptomyces sp. NPDC048278 TaxID=3155809 RepID=UPI0034191591